MALQPIGAERYAEETRHCNGDVSSGRPAGWRCIGHNTNRRESVFWGPWQVVFSVTAKVGGFDYAKVVSC